MTTTGSFLADLIVVIGTVVIVLTPLVALDAAFELVKWWKRRHVSRLTGR